jgi:hypothetical protein
MLLKVVYAAYSFVDLRTRGARFFLLLRRLVRLEALLVMIMNGFLYLMMLLHELHLYNLDIFLYCSTILFIVSLMLQGCSKGINPYMDDDISVRNYLPLGNPQLVIPAEYLHVLLPQAFILIFEKNGSFVII